MLSALKPPAEALEGSEAAEPFGRSTSLSAEEREREGRMDRKKYEWDSIPERFAWRKPDRPERWPGEFEADRFVYNNIKVPWLLRHEREQEEERRYFEALMEAQKRGEPCRATRPSSLGPRTR